MTAEYQAIVEDLVAAIVAAWPTVGQVFVDRYQQENIVYSEVQNPGEQFDTALIKLESCEGDEGTPVTDSYLMTWRIGGKFWVGSDTSDSGRARVDRVSTLRSQLLALTNPGDVAYMPMVPSMDVSDDDDSLGDSYVASLTFTCMLEIDR